MGGVLGWVSIAVIKHHGQKQLVAKRVYFSSQFLEQELKQRPLKIAAYWSYSWSYLLFFFFCATQDHLPRRGTTHNGLGPHINHISPAPQMSYSFAYSPI